MNLKSLTHFEGVLGTILDTESLVCHALHYTPRDDMSTRAQKSFQHWNYRVEWELKRQTIGLPDKEWPHIVFEWAKQNRGLLNPTSVKACLETCDAYMLST